MARIIMLDSGPLGLASGNPSKLGVLEITDWHITARLNGAIVVIPEVADYEVRRELLRTQAREGIERLDVLTRELRYLPITTAAMRQAASIWADARRRGVPTAVDEALDGDVILAAQALGFVGLSDTLTVATDNVDHLSRYVKDSRPWEKIIP